MGIHLDRSKINSFDKYFRLLDKKYHIGSYKDWKHIKSSDKKYSIVRFGVGSHKVNSCKDTFFLLLHDKDNWSKCSIIGFLIAQLPDIVNITSNKDNIYIGEYKISYIPDHITCFRKLWLRMQLPNVSKPFNVNERFDLLAQIVENTVSGQIHALIACGNGGAGKTFTILSKLDELGVNYVRHSGRITPIALFDVLSENDDTLIVFDDCDEVLLKGAEFLKSAIDNKRIRKVSYRTPHQGVKEIIFSGKIIFITNLAPEKIDQAIVSRAILINLSMSRSEYLDRMRYILPLVAEEYDLDFHAAEEVMAFIEVFVEMNPMLPKDLNLRTLTKIISIRSSDKSIDPDHWLRMAQYILTTS